MSAVAHDQIPVGDGVELHVASAGRADGPVVLLVHGFPELWFSWRHQIAPLAEAGYRVLVPDLRGIGGSTQTAPIEDYDNATVQADLFAVLDHAGTERAAFVGHDFGSSFSWHIALAAPERVACVAGLSVPAVPRAPAQPLPIMRRHLGDDFYIAWFQTPGPADAALAADVRRTLATTKVWNPAWAEQDENPPTPLFMTDEELQVYVDAYTRTGFTGGLNWYRNIDRNWHADEALVGRTIDVPACFITGERDPVERFMPIAAMDGYVTDLRERVVIDGAGHWIQQERPDEVNAVLLRFLADAYPA